jgi:N,N'-diacetyllegionaminate synthase
MTYLIAEIGQDHNGSLLHAKALVRACTFMVDAVKFQIHLPEVEEARDAEFRVPIAGYASRYEYWRKTGFTFDEWCELALLCKNNGLHFMASTFSLEGLKLYQKILEHEGIPHNYKVASGEIANFPYEHIQPGGNTRLFVSTGMMNERDWHDVQRRTPPGVRVTWLHCTSKYPHELAELPATYSMGWGLSYHGSQVEGILHAIAHGASVVEFHVTESHYGAGPDAKASIHVDCLGSIARMCTAMTSDRMGQDGPTRAGVETQRLFKARGYVTNYDLWPGYKIKESDLREVRGSVNGLRLDNLIDRTVGENVIPKGYYIRERDLL